MPVARDRAESESLDPADGGVEEDASVALAPQALWHAVAARLRLPERYTRYVLQQSDKGATLPFLARYRRDETGNLSEESLREILDTAEEVAAVHRRRQYMLRSLAERHLLTKDLRARLLNAVHLSQLEDAWEPYKVRRTSLASRGREAGLGELVNALLYTNAPLPHLRAAVRRVEDGERLLIAIIVEEVERQEPLRQELLLLNAAHASLRSTVVVRARKKAAKQLDEDTFEQQQKKFLFYNNRSWPVRSVAGHILLALHRGETAGVLKVGVTPAGASYPQFRRRVRELLPCVEERLGGAREARKSQTHGEEYERQLLRQGLQAVFDHLLSAVHRTLRRDLQRGAEKEAIAVFAHNLRHVLLQRPLSHARVLAMDPGFTHGVKCVALDESGAVLHTFLCTLMDEDRMLELMHSAVQRYRLSKIVIGDGTASQRTAELVAKLIATRELTGVEFAVVSEAGASVYSVSDVAKEEFPNLDRMYRGAVSIGRRVLDPLSELVKIPARSMGIGMYQHDVPEKELTVALERVIGSCVAAVGVNASSAHRYVLERVPGITKKVVDQLVLARRAGRLSSRADLRRMPCMTDAEYLMIAGFLRFPNAADPLDQTNVHPESYELVRGLLQRYETGTLLPPSLPSASPSSSAAADAAAPATHIATPAGQLTPAQTREAVGRALSAASPEVLAHVARAMRCGVESLRLVAQELSHPGLDPRATLPHAGLMRRSITDVKALRRGDALSGVVRSVTTFGAFVDCGLHDDVLVRDIGADHAYIGARLTGLVFVELDALGRPRVEYAPPASAQGASPSAAAGRGVHAEFADTAGPDGDAKVSEALLQRAGGTSHLTVYVAAASRRSGEPAQLQQRPPSTAVHETKPKSSASRDVSADNDDHDAPKQAPTKAAAAASEKVRVTGKRPRAPAAEDASDTTASAKKRSRGRPRRTQRPMSPAAQQATPTPAPEADDELEIFSF